MYYNNVQIGDKVWFVTFIGWNVAAEVISTDKNEFGETEFATIKITDENQKYTDYEIGQTFRVGTVYLRKILDKQPEI